MQRSGQCLCGAVKVSGNFKPGIQACHCQQCQRWTGGGPYLAATVSDLEIDGADQIEHYRASGWGERGNCRKCGSIIYWKMQGKVARSIALGLLDDQSGMAITEEIFVDHRAAWMAPVEGATQSTEAEEKVLLEEYLAKEQKR